MRCKVSILVIKEFGLFINEGRHIYETEIGAFYLETAAKDIIESPDKLYSWYISLYNSFHWNGGTVETVQQKIFLI